MNAHAVVDDYRTHNRFDIRVRECIKLVDQLSVREKEVLQLLVDGKSGQLAADALFISIHTLRTHIKNLLMKMNCNSMLQAVSIAVTAGLLPTVLAEKSPYS